VITHGTVHAYQNRSCRCPECRAAWAAHWRQRRAERRISGHCTACGRPLPSESDTPRRHRTRCDRCRARHNSKQRAQYSAEHQRVRRYTRTVLVDVNVPQRQPARRVPVPLPPPVEAPHYTHVWGRWAR